MGGNGTSVAFTGQGFSYAENNNLTLYASFGGIQADSFRYISDREVWATWSSFGLPKITGNFELSFVDEEELTYGITFARPIEISNPPFDGSPFTTSIKRLACSYMGGCEYEVYSIGMAATLLTEESYISMCGEVCDLIPELSDVQTTVCKLPGVFTSHSYNHYDIQPQLLEGTITPSEASSLYDGDVTSGYET